MLCTEGVVLGHHISPTGIQVDPAKIKFIRDLPVPTTQKDVRSCDKCQRMGRPVKSDEMPLQP
jgi:hypothetical protein